MVPAVPAGVMVLVRLQTSALGLFPTPFLLMCRPQGLEMEWGHPEERG